MLAISTGYYDTLKFFHVLAAITWVGARSTRRPSRRR